MRGKEGEDIGVISGGAWQVLCQSRLSCGANTSICDELTSDVGHGMYGRTLSKKPVPATTQMLVDETSNLWFRIAIQDRCL